MAASEIAPPRAIAFTGDWNLGFSLASTDGNALIRPIANEVRLDTFTPAFEFASVELTIARNTRIQNRPYSERARPSHEFAPEVVNVANLAGPNATSTA